MILRKVEKSDWNSIIEIARKHEFPFPEFGKFITLYLVEDNNKVIAFGYLKLVAEAVFQPDLGASPRIIIESLKLLNEQAIKDAQSFGVSQIEGFIKNPKFAKIMQQHFNYVPITGTGLVYNLNG